MSDRSADISTETMQKPQGPGGEQKSLSPHGKPGELGQPGPSPVQPGKEPDDKKPKQ